MQRDEFDESPAFEPEPEEASSHDGTSRPLVGKVELAADILRHVHEAIGNALTLLEGGDAPGARRKLAELVTSKRASASEGGTRSVEGVFDGCAMIGADGRSYPVPPNYASKSRLVEGDVLKLSIRTDGSFVFKQIGPVERRRVVGKVAMDPSTDSFVVSCQGRVYKVLHASMTFYKAAPGDEAVVLIPKSSTCVWAAVENVMKKV